MRRDAMRRDAMRRDAMRRDATRRDATRRTSAIEREYVVACLLRAGPDSGRICWNFRYTNERRYAVARTMGTRHGRRGRTLSTAIRKVQV